MYLRGYCNSMEKLLAAWGNHVDALLKISETVPGSEQVMTAAKREELRALVVELGKVSKLLKNECLPA